MNRYSTHCGPETGHFSISFPRAVAADAAEKDLLVFSYEKFYILDRPQISLLADCLPDAHAIQVVIFLRRQDEHTESLCNQYYRAARTSFEEVEAFESELTIFKPIHDYATVIRNWQSVVGEESVIPVIYDKKKSSVPSFFDAAGVPVDLADYPLFYSNPAIDSYGASVLRWVKKLAGPGDDMAALMEVGQAALKEHFVTPESAHPVTLLSASQRREIMDGCAATNEWVRARFFPDQPALFDEGENAREVDFDPAAGRDLAERIVAHVRARGPGAG